MLGVIDANIRLKDDSYKVTLEVMTGDTMSVPLDRNVLNSFGYSLTKNLQYDEAVMEIFNINTG